MHENNASGRRLLFRWVRATWIGWLLGLPLIIALALAGEAIGIGGAQVIVGIGMGMGVGLMQGRALRGVLQKPSPWFWSCVGGLAVPFLVTDLANAAGWSSAYSLYAAIAFGGFIVGTWQALILRSRFHNSRWWVVASGLGWPLAGGASAVADWLSHRQALRGLWGAIVFLGIVAVGGLILGITTGLSLVRMLRNEPTLNQKEATESSLHTLI